jgi:transcriptional regulator with XRE-family HTH domain
LDLKLLQEDVASILEISVCSLSNWENNASVPQINYGPKIIAFLGFNPFKVQGEGLGARIRRYRFEHGLNLEQLGDLVGVDGTSVGAWESGESIPLKKTLDRLDELLVSKIPG